MNPQRLKHLQSAGWQLGSARDFLQLKPDEAALVEIKVSLINAVKSARTRGNLSQVELAQRMKSSQSRVAKIEAGDPSVSLDLIVRALIASGASKREIQNAFTARVTQTT